MAVEVISTFDPKKEKFVKAGILNKKVFTKKVKEKHLMRKFNAYGIQEDVITTLIQKECETVCIKTETDTLISSLADWLASEIRVMDFGSGKQRFYPVNRMTVK